MATDNNTLSNHRPSTLICAVCLANLLSWHLAWGDTFKPIATQIQITYPDGREYSESYQFASDKQFSDMLDKQIIGNPLYNEGPILPEINATADIQGNPLTVTSAVGSSVISISSEKLDIKETFVGATRKDSVKLLETWGKEFGGTLFQKVNARSTLSTIGGVSGYIPRTPALDSSIDGSGFSANVLKELVGEERESHLSILTGFSSYSANGKTADVYTLPINYNWEFHEGWALLLNVPLTYIDTEGVSSFSGALGTGLRIPVSKYINTGKIKWDLVPLFRVGAIGSEQNNVETSIIFSGGIQSNVGIPIGHGFSLVIQNQYNYYSVNSITAYTDVRVNGNLIEIPSITNSIYRNGAQLVKDFDYKLFGRTLMADISFADIRLSGATLAIDNQQEIGFDIGLRRTSKSKFKLDIMRTAEDVMALDKKKLIQTAKDKVSGSEFKIGFKYTQATGIDSAYGLSTAFSY
jgi:hypothetical protein